MLSAEKNILEFMCKGTGKSYYICQVVWFEQKEFGQINFLNLRKAEKFNIPSFLLFSLAIGLILSSSRPLGIYIVPQAGLVHFFLRQIFMHFFKKKERCCCNFKFFLFIFCNTERTNFMTFSSFVVIVQFKSNLVHSKWLVLFYYVIIPP